MAGKYVLEDDCLSPDITLRIDYKGRDPFKFYSQIVMLLRDVLEIRSMNIWQREFRWDFTGDPVKFFYRVIAQKPYDGWTKAYIEIIFQGTNPTDPSKDGEMVIFITPKLRTEMPQSTVWQRSQIYRGLRWFYFRTFYGDARRILIGKCIHATDKIVDRLKDVLGIQASKEEL